MESSLQLAYRVHKPKGSGFCAYHQAVSSSVTNLVFHLPSQRPYTNLGMQDGPCVVQWSPEGLRLHSYLVKCHV